MLHSVAIKGKRCKVTTDGEIWLPGFTTPAGV